ncbi:MAG: bifunctional sulfate adenylyltransferase/adenylylsulfate kinase [Chloracidobacterium sp.]|nr:bifunctional sulfate adenylyltransferase/adenylylsulfate kinase [Chloracidobacterium sp.]
MSHSSKLVLPYCGRLVDLSVCNEEVIELQTRANRLPSIHLSKREICDLELLTTGAFSPLDRFMGKEDFEKSVRDMRLDNGIIFPLPVSLSVPEIRSVKLDADIALRDSRNDLLAVMTVEEIYEWDHAEFARLVLGTNDLRHPLISEFQRRGNVNISGKLRVPALTKHFDFRDLRLTPREVRSRLDCLGNENVVAFQTRNPMHRGHEEICRRAMSIAEATLLLHPTVGPTRSGDVDHFTRVRTYKEMIRKYFSDEKVLLSLIPLAMRMAGPREAVLHMIVRRNYGANHFIVGRDHASPGLDSKGNPFYVSTAAQELATQFSEEIGIKVLAFDEMVYLPEEDRYEEVPKLRGNQSYHSMSGTQIREKYIGEGQEPPDWYMRSEVAEILSEPYQQENGICVWFTGLSGAGKSTIAEILTKLLNDNGRKVTLLDGDMVRTNLSKGLGFSKEDRDLNILRIGFVAAEVVKHGGVAICAAISPYKVTRNEVRQMFAPDKFVEVFVDTPISVCELRDAKGNYAKARLGEISNFTGINDPYEVPEGAEIVLDTVKFEAVENAQRVLDYLSTKGLTSGKVRQ